MDTCESVFSVASIALHPWERERCQVVDGPAHRRHGGVPGAQRPVSGDTDDPGGVDVSTVHIHAHTHLISTAEGRHPTRAAGAVISATVARETSVHAAARAAVVGQVSVVRLVHPRAQHAALLHVAEDLIDAKTDGLHLRVLLQVRPQYPYVIHGFHEPPRAPAPARGI